MGNLNLGPINQYLGGPVGSIVGALIFLIIGFFIAKIIGGLFRSLLSKGKVNQRMNSSTGKAYDIEAIGGKIAFWFVFILAIAGALSALKLNTISTPLTNMINQVLSFLPVLLGVVIIGVVGWVIATVARTAISTALSKTGIDEKLDEEAGIKSISSSVGDIVYSLILLVVITMILGKLGLDGLFAPLTNMIGKATDYIPSIFAAGIIFFIGLVVARIVRSIVVNLVSALNLQEFAEKAGISKDGENTLAKLAGSIVFLIITITTSIVALDALKIEVISRPATNMLNTILDAIPNVLTAAAVLIITYYVISMVANIVKGILENTQINELPEKLGLQSALGQTRVSDLVGHLMVFFAMLLASVFAADKLGVEQLGNIITMFIGFGADIILGSIIMFIGFWLAGLVAGVVERSEQGSQFLANIVRVLIMGLVLAMGLKAMGIADSIVNLAFGLTLGSVAVAFALSFGLGGQEAAARFLRNLQDKYDNK